MNPSTTGNTLKDTAKRLNVKIRIGKWGIILLPKSPIGKSYKFVQIVPLTGWTFDPKEIIESFASDDAFKISYKKRKQND